MPNTPIASQSCLHRMRNGTAMAAKMMIPPIVGVPALTAWPAGPSSRMCWPNSRSRRNEMNCGERKMHMSRDAVPAMRTRPTLRPRGCAPPRDAGRRPRADAARALDEHGVAGLEQPRERVRGLAGARHGDRLARERAAGGGGERADGDEHVHPGGGGVAPIAAWKAASSGPSSSMSPSTATRRPPPGLDAATAARSSRAARIDIGLAL